VQLGTAVAHKQTLLINNANRATSEIWIRRVIGNRVRRFIPKAVSLFRLLKDESSLVRVTAL
jgi:hypothetical protein